MTQRRGDLAASATWVGCDNEYLRLAVLLSSKVRAAELERAQMVVQAEFDKLIAP